MTSCANANPCSHSRPAGNGNDVPCTAALLASRAKLRAKRESMSGNARSTDARDARSSLTPPVVVDGSGVDGGCCRAPSAFFPAPSTIVRGASATLDLTSDDCDGCGCGEGRTSSPPTAAVKSNRPIACNVLTLRGLADPALERGRTRLAEEGTTSGSIAGTDSAFSVGEALSDTGKANGIEPALPSPDRLHEGV
jgi:hypothetical protein